MLIGSFLIYSYDNLFLSFFFRNWKKAHEQRKMVRLSDKRNIMSYDDVPVIDKALLEKKKKKLTTAEAAKRKDDGKNYFWIMEEAKTTTTKKDKSGACKSEIMSCSAPSIYIYDLF